MPVALAPGPSMPPLVLIAHDDPGTADALRHAVESAAGWQVLMADPSHAGLTAALASGPSVALIGCATLANLPSGCRIPLVAIGDDDRPADVRAALDAGARSLLAWPDGVADLPGELARLRPRPAGRRRPFRAGRRRPRRPGRRRPLVDRTRASLPRVSSCSDPSVLLPRRERMGWTSMRCGMSGRWSWSGLGHLSRWASRHGRSCSLTPLALRSCR